MKCSGGSGNRLLAAVSLLGLAGFLLPFDCPLRAADVGSGVFLRGDANIDGRVTISDAMLVFLWHFTEFPLPCEDAGDADDNGLIEIVDGVRILVSVFDGGLISQPFPIPGPDPVGDNLICERYDPKPPEPVDDLLRIEGAAAVPGEVVILPLRLTSAVGVDGLHLVLRYDPALFEPRLFGDGGIPALKAFLTGTVLERNLPDRDSVFPAYLRVQAFPEEGILQLGFIPDLFGLDTIRPVEDAPVGNLIGKVSPDASPGARIEISFARRVEGPLALETELSNYGHPRLPRTEGAAIMVVSGSLFIRGDSNGDGAVDISDPIHALDGLFTGAAEIRCSAASDANDDDQVDIADAIRLLDFLFLGGPAPAAPYPACGADHAGTLDCEQYSACR